MIFNYYDQAIHNRRV